MYLGLPALSFLTAVPTAELEPITENYVQADEVRQPVTTIRLRFYRRGRYKRFEF